jgi:hypothetical protein
LDSAYFGSSLAAPGDLDGDGVPDLLVLSKRRVWLLHLARNGKVKDASAVIDITGSAYGGNLAVHEGLLLMGGLEEDRLHIAKLTDL